MIDKNFIKIRKTVIFTIGINDYFYDVRGGVGPNISP